MATTQKPHPMHTAEGWDATAEDYDVGVKEVNFTPKYAKDILHYALTGNINSEEKEVIESINKLSNVHIIDIAGGSGPMTLHIGRLLSKSKNPNAKILGTDFSPKMVEIMERHVKEENLQTFVECKVMDGQALELSDNSIDFAFSMFGVFLFPQPLKGISEIYRVLKKGGTIGISSWTKFHTIMDFHIEAIQKILGPTPRTRTKEEMTEALKSCGFQDIRIESTVHNAEFGNSAKFLQVMQNNPGFGHLKEKLGEEGWKKYEQEIERQFQEKFPNYSLPCEALLAVATK